MHNVMYQSVSIHKPGSTKSVVDMTKKVIIAATELHRAAGKALKRVALQDVHLVVERDGYPIAVLISYPEYEELIRLRAMKAHRELLRELGREAEKQGLTEEQLLAELEADKRAVYTKAYGTNPA